MPRPFKNATGEQLFALVREHATDEHILQGIRAELLHRTTRRMRALLEEVDDILLSLRNTTPGSDEDQLVPVGVTAQRDLLEEVPATPVTVPVLTIPDRQGDRGGGTPQRQAPLFPDLEYYPPDDRRKPDVFTFISAPGVNRPPKWRRPVSHDLTLEIPSGASNARRFRIALEALISEISATGNGNRLFALSDGVSTPLSGPGVGYVFDFVEDASLFADTPVEVLLGARRCKGTIVALPLGKIIIAVEVDLGPEIRECTLKIDDTALLVALCQRLEEIDNRKLSINTVLADGAIVADRQAVVFPQNLALPREFSLEEKQREAVLRGLSTPVTFLWGPPGTGKTHTLAALVTALYERGDRVLVCSNTNQAVDQLLVKLCQQLKIDHPALRDGRVLRIGRATDLAGFEQHLVIDKIVERLSRDLVTRRAELERAAVPLQRTLEETAAALGLFQQQDEAAAVIQSLDADLQAKNTALEKAKHAAEQSTRFRQRAIDEIASFTSASQLRRLFMPSERRLQQVLAAAESDVVTANSQLAASSALVDNAHAELRRHRALFDELQQRLNGVDRNRWEGERRNAEEALRPIAEELATIAAQLATLESEILNGARVIGATVTRAYLSARELGSFDAVIIDEASMVLLPALYVSAGLARTNLIISGDFNQLPPIVPTNEAAVLEIIGNDVFAAAGVDSAPGIDVDQRLVMLNRQWRMHESICKLIVETMEYRNLETHPKVKTRRPLSVPRSPFDRPLTVIDSSRLWPFECRNRFGSRFNLMHTLLVRNLCWQLREDGFITDPQSVGVCTPYSAQAKLLRGILKDDGLSDQVTASTVHRYQGAERRMIVLDIPESIGSGFNIGQFIQADSRKDDGAKLQNVAISRAQDHLVILANLTYLDPKLPSYAMLRKYLHAMQGTGTVVDGLDVLAFRPVYDDLRRETQPELLASAPDRYGMFRQDGFDRLFRADVAGATKGVAVFSGFITPQRTAVYGDLFRRKIAERVAVRCVTRPPQYNGAVDPLATRQALDALEAIGVVVDTRQVIHEKVVIIDGEIVWFGSLNPLSHTSRTDEVMMRVVSREVATNLALLLSVGRGENRDGLAVRKENPTHSCGGRMYYAKGRHGPYFRCERCDGTQNIWS